MATIAITWNNPTDPEKLKAISAREEAWRKTTLSQPGVQSFEAFVHPFGLTNAMVTDSFATTEDANRYLSSPEFAGIITEMSALGSTDVKVELWKRAAGVPKPLRP